MSKYVINLINKEKNIATSKAKDDIAFFLESKGYETLTLSLFKNRWDKLINTRKKINTNFGSLKTGDIFVLQYPTYLGYRFENKLISFLKKRSVKIIVVIHDLDSLRFTGKRQPTLSDEISELNRTDYVIASNKIMEDMLIQKGLHTPTTSLEIFDYFHTETIFGKKRQPVLNYAGNLNKSQFIYDFPKDTKIKLFGNINNENLLPSYEEYLGTFPPDKIGLQFKEGYGLVWDGESSKEIRGVYGNYMKYNNPHKLSLYLSFGMPVIFWRGAALANFVKENKVGILVDDLSEVSQILSEVTQENYEQMCENANEISKKLTQGYFIKKAIENAEEQILG
ncbi:sugar transferase [Pediococcus acidilactici]|uniref:sugar transferase n=1 Tax=Pediococcus acidilactici TaxID=1254 RepID=UPI001913F718|nr:sugar transferase [Pediococcus acidilactici]QQP83825.1 sugar transferase [Pediococcus acidilactici]